MRYSARISHGMALESCAMCEAAFGACQMLNVSLNADCERKIKEIMDFLIFMRKKIFIFCQNKIFNNLL